MPTIDARKHPTGKITYRARVRLPGQPAISKSFRTKTEAKSWGQRIEASIREGNRLPGGEARKHTFADLLDRYIETVLPRKPKSTYKQSAQLNWWKQHLGKYRLIDITPALIAKYRDKLLAEPTPRGPQRATSTGARYLSVLSHAFKVAVKEWGLMDSNPVDKVFRPKERPGRDRFLEKEEVEKLLEVCKSSRNKNLFAIVKLAVCSGMRRGELLSLKWHANVDFERRIIVLKETKNGETRAIPMSDMVHDLLLDLWSKRRLDSSYVFPGQSGAKPAEITTAWKNALKKAGIDGCCFHSLRHTAGSHMANLGASPSQIAAVLGHKTLGMVKRYAHLNESSTAKVLKQMNDELFG